jgi:hypothetical protein
VASQGYGQLIDTCKLHYSSLHDWECVLIDSVEAAFHKEDYLTDPQIETLERIWGFVTREEHP